MSFLRLIPCCRGMPNPGHTGHRPSTVPLRRPANPRPDEGIKSSPTTSPPSFTPPLQFPPCILLRTHHKYSSSSVAKWIGMSLVSSNLRTPRSPPDLMNTQNISFAQQLKRWILPWNAQPPAFFPRHRQSPALFSSWHWT